MSAIAFSHRFSEKMAASNAVFYVNKKGKISFRKHPKNVQGLKEAVAKIQNLAPVIGGLSPEGQGHFCYNLHKLKVACPFTYALTTTLDLAHYSPLVSAANYALFHATTYQRPKPGEVPLPTDHGGLFFGPYGCSAVICDGMGHADPINIGKVAAEITHRLLLRPLPANKAPYVASLQELNREFRCREGTSLIEVFFSKVPEGVEVTFGRAGDSDLILVDRRGKVLFATLDPKKLLDDDKKPIGLLGIGGGWSDAWLKNVDFSKFSTPHCLAIVASDGLTALFHDPETGLLDNPRFEYALGTGTYLPPGAPLPSVPERDYSAPIVINHLAKAARAAAEKVQGGDDTLIIVIDTEAIF